MKKEALSIIIILIIIFTANLNFIQVQNSEKLSELILMNINALANNESSGTKCCPDPGETCHSSSGYILADHDKYRMDQPCE